MQFSIIYYLLLVLPLGFASPALYNARNACPSAGSEELQYVKQKFTSSGLVPTYISSFNPTLLTFITYTVATGGVKEVLLGNTFNSSETLLQPSVILTREAGRPASTTYSLFFINFDNPNPALPPSLHVPFLHWQESGLKACSSTPGKQVELFISSVPPSVAPDRYTYLIFREPAGYVPSNATSDTRIILNINEYAASQGLTLVGGNYFLEGQQNNVPPA